MFSQLKISRDVWNKRLSKVIDDNPRSAAELCRLSHCNLMEGKYALVFCASIGLVKETYVKGKCRYSRIQKEDGR
jgi:hypothetical protein